MSLNVTIIDYGIGNLLSVSRALEKCGAQVRLSDRPEGILSADRLVLPGVGAFSKGMQGLRERGLIEPLKEYALKSRPLLGICLGMQMLFSSSLEFGQQEGLSLIEGQIVPVDPTDADGIRLKVPHIGWSSLQRPDACASWAGSIFCQVNPGAHAYFVHSFTAKPAREQDRLADTFYGNARISAAVRKENISGCQFHPEKSGLTGLRIMEGFLRA
jgi:imidazole glycerol-phosphate synthase subunit HisH